MLVRTAGARRGGMTLVETAMILSIFLMFLFGVYEYCRYLFLLQVTTNAAREGCRLAVCNLSNTAWTGTVISTDTTYPSSRPVFAVANATQEVTGKLAGVDRMIRMRGTNIPIIQVYPVDSSALHADPPVFRPKTQPDSTASPPITTAAWNQCRFPEKLAVRVTGLYDPILPNFLFMGGIGQIEIVVVMGSEG